MLFATARFVITTIQRKFLYFFVFFFPKVPRSIPTSGISLFLNISLLSHVQRVSRCINVLWHLSARLVTGFGQSRINLINLGKTGSNCHLTSFNTCAMRIMFYGLDTRIVDMNPVFFFCENENDT